MNKMAGHPPTVAPSLITIFFTSTTRPVPAGCSPGISSHLPRVTKHPWRVGIRGSPGASRMPPNLASKRLGWAKGRWEQFTPCWDNVDNVPVKSVVKSARQSAARPEHRQATQKSDSVSGWSCASFQIKVVICTVAQHANSPLPSYI